VWCGINLSGTQEEHGMHNPEGKERIVPALATLERHLRGANFLRTHEELPKQVQSPPCQRPP